MIRHYIKIISRTLRKEKFRYIITTLGISVGIVIFSVMLLLVDGMYNTWNEVPDANKLYKFKTETELPDGEKINSWVEISNKDLKEINKLSIPEIDKIGLSRTLFNQLFICNSEDGDRLFQAVGSYANYDFIDLMDFKFIEGGINEYISDQSQIIITEKYAKLLFGTTKAIGSKMFVYNDNNDFIGSYTITGVIKSVRSINFSYIFDFIILDKFEEETNAATNSIIGMPINSIISLKKDFDINRINIILKAYRMDTHGVDNETNNTYAQLVPYTEDVMRPPMALFIGMVLIGGMILAISLFNFVNLLLASMQARVRQFSLRKIVGAQPWTFVTMIVLEILPVILVSVLLSYFLLELFVYFSSNSSIINVSLSSFVRMVFVYPFKIGFWMLLGSILLSLIMCRRLQKIVLAQGIRGELFSIGKNRGRNILLVIELMLTLIFINASVFFTTLGFNNIPEQYQPLSKAQSKAILIVPLDKLRLISEREEIVNRIKSVSGVNLVVNGFHLGNMGWVTDNYTINANEIFDDYFEFWELNAPINKREIAPREAIINRGFADKLGEENTNSFTLEGEMYDVVGVVDEIPLSENGKYNALLGSLPSYRNNLKNVLVKCDPKSKNKTQTEIIKIIREYLPATVEYKIANINDFVNIEISLLKSYAIIMLIASLFSIIITVLGIYTSITYDTNSKRKEIAIRKINGASRKNILVYISKVYVVIILMAGVLASLLHRFIITKMFQSLGNITPEYSMVYDIAILIFITLIITFIISFKIRKAMSENPAEVIKSE